MQCPRCHAELPEDVRFCTQCGLNLAEAAAAEKNDKAEAVETGDSFGTSDPYGMPDPYGASDPYSAPDPYNTPHPYGTANLYSSGDAYDPYANILKEKEELEEEERLAAEKEAAEKAEAERIAAEKEAAEKAEAEKAAAEKAEADRAAAEKAAAEKAEAEKAAADKAAAEKAAAEKAAAEKAQAAKKETAEKTERKVTGSNVVDFDKKKKKKKRHPIRKLVLLGAVYVLASTAFFPNAKYAYTLDDLKRLSDIDYLESRFYALQDRLMGRTDEQAAAGSSAMETQEQSVEEAAYESKSSGSEDSGITVYEEAEELPEVDSSAIEVMTEDSYQSEPAQPVTRTVQVLRISDSAMDTSRVEDSKRVGVIAASASSTIQQATVTNDAIQAFDNDPQTNWQEGVDGPGLGQMLNASFDSCKVSALKFRVGNWKNDKYFYGNNRPQKMTLRIGDLTTQLTFPDAWEEFCATIDPPIEADALSLTIDSVYAGTSWDDTVVTDVLVYRE